MKQEMGLKPAKKPFDWDIVKGCVGCGALTILFPVIVVLYCVSDIMEKIEYNRECKQIREERSKQKQK